MHIGKILLLIFVFCLPVFAENNLQKQFENIDLATKNVSFYDALYLINDDFKSYNGGTDSMYGRMKYLEEQYAKNNKQPDVAILKNMIQKYKQVYDSQNTNSLVYFYIDDTDYVKLNENTKKLVSFYNLMYNSSISQQTNLSLYYENLGTLKNKFLSDKNNIKQNFELYSELNNEAEQINDYIQNLKSRHNYDNIKVHNLTQLKDDIKYLCTEIHNYSYDYEKKKYQNWLIRNNKKQPKGTLQQFVYDSKNQPQLNELYIHNPKDLYLVVRQTVPGGIIISGEPNIGYGFYTINDIFLQTSKSYADGTYILEPIIAEYKGFYDYISVLGAKRRIYKFYRYGQNEINSNFKIPGEKFYFYTPTFY